MQLCSIDSLFVAGKGQLGLQSRPCGSGAQPLQGCGVRGAAGGGRSCGGVCSQPALLLAWGTALAQGLIPIISVVLCSPFPPSLPPPLHFPALGAHRSPPQRNPQCGFGDVRPNRSAVTQGQPHPTAVTGGSCSGAMCWEAAAFSAVENPIKLLLNSFAFFFPSLTCF